MKKYIASIKYKNHTYKMLVSGKDKKSVTKNVTDFYMNLLKEKASEIEIELEERK